MSVPEPPKKISLALGGSKKLPASTNGVKRPHAALQEQDDDNEVEERATKVSHFDRNAGGAIDESKKTTEKGPLVISRQANRNWKDAANIRRRQKSGLPGRESQMLNGNGIANGGIPAQPEATYGLVVSRRDEASETLGADGEAANDDNKTEPEPEQKPQTAEDRAMDALLGKTKKSDLIVPAMTEEEAFSNDFSTAPEMATLEDYTRVPVEQFGAAMLRGMGWKDGEGIGLNKGKKAEKTKIPERRPALLGIGAKEEAAVAGEMGAWGKAARGTRGKEPVIYNPILLRDKKTGEMFTEEEVQKRKERDEREKYEVEFERREKERDREQRRKRDDDDGDREHRREKDKRRERDRRDDRDRDRDRDSHRRRHDDSEDEEERRRRKEKERRRREREGDDYDRERSKRHERDDRKHRDRSRDRRR